MQKILNYINGKLVAPVSGNYFDNFNPSRGEVYSLIPDSDEKDIEAAVSAAQEAFKTWSKTSKEERSKILLKIASLIEENLPALAHAETLDNGKPLGMSKKVDIPRAAANFHFYATALLHFSGHSYDMDGKAINYTTHKPIGLAGCISPWNLPLYLFSWKIAPALAAGCTVIAKPSEITPMTAFLLSEICQKAGLPKGVLNIVHGYGHKAGSAMVSHPHIPAISFTGGTKTGADIARVAAPMFKKLSLELGGKNPNIIFDDCDLDKAIEMTVHSSFSNQGQICLCGSRIFIHQSIYKTFQEKFVERVKKLNVGDPLLAETNVGAVVSEAHMEKILSYVQLAQEEGGTILLGGKRKIVEGECKNGWFVEPTIIEGLPYNCRTNMEEIFGPVVTLTPFETEEEVIMMANSTKYGLSASIWSENLSRAHRVAEQIDAGIVWVNTWLLRDLRTPFGGIKQSGVGREGGFHALEFFTEPKNICIKL